MDNRTIVLPSTRAIRAQLTSLSETLFLPNYLTMSDFISKLCLVEEYKFMDEDTRILLLLEASDFNAFKALQIERNFFTFTKNSTYIFKFFEELSAEQYDIQELSGADIYAEYDEHIAILQELYTRYEKLCNERKLLDKIFLPKIYTFNKAYARSCKEVTIHLEGHLTNFEFELLEKLKEFTSLFIVVPTTQFNKKVQQRFESLGIALEPGYEHTISLNDSQIVERVKLSETKNVSCEALSESLLEVAFIKQKIYEFIEKGYEPEKIAIILPDEQKVSILKSFDGKSNLNFAMGESYINTFIYKKLDATLTFIEQDSKENEARLERFGDEFYITLFSLYKRELSSVDLPSFLSSVGESIQIKEEKKIFLEELYSFEKLIHYMKGMSVKSALKLFMQRLSKRTLDDVRGGKITVMGVLETRNVSFDAVVIIDFDDNNVPTRSDKDMFLNTQIREKAQLPTTKDRENLQKHYYEMLMRRSQEVAISYVHSTQNAPSRFLKQLNIRETNSYSESDYASILFESKQPSHCEEEPIIQEYSFKGIELSATRLKTYLSCKRKYYYKYIESLKEHEIPQDIPKEHEIGTSVHEALKELYRKNNSYTEIKKLQDDFESELDKLSGESELEHYLIKLQKERFKEFYVNEIERFKQGWKVFSCEESYKVMFNGMQLVGKIDRIDKRDDELEVLDYKTGNYTLYNKNNFPDATDFQLEFYYLLASELGKVTRCAFYDLKESEIIPEAFLKEKLALLASHIQDLLSIESVNFEKCEDIKNCQYCEYALICGRV
ncbi:MAG: PD-(D/E)XK nuclease family protein [Campylobacterales bacterium]|nr:PD-(D/E)XK nuclease family protein [Campylobacterales bacterium]